MLQGATIAFKDMALSILPHRLTTAAKKNQVKNEIVILTATSGDTGKAALAGFADVPGTKIIVFYPKNGVSRVQELQMVTQKGENTSCLLYTSIREDLAMTGEITLRGKVLPLGGLKEKLLEAKNAGIHTVLIPEHNQADVEEFSSEITGGLSILPVKNMDEVLREAFAEPVAGRAPEQ